MNDLERLQRKIDRLDQKIKGEPPVIGTVPDSTPLRQEEAPVWPFPVDGADTPSAPAPDQSQGLCSFCGAGRSENGCSWCCGGVMCRIECRVSSRGG